MLTRLINADASADASAGQAPAAAAGVQYFSAGQSWCGYSRKQQELLAQPTAAAVTSVTYVDCSSNPQHPACSIQPQPRGFPYLARCQGNDCAVVKYGFARPEELAAVTAAIDAAATTPLP